MTRRKTSLMALLVCLVLPAGAWAGGRESKERTAKTACLAGDYTRGVALLAELYVSTGDITYLFNQGRCFEQNGKYEEAVARFREYQQKNADAGHQPDDQAEKHIAKCQALLDSQKPVAVAPPAAPIVAGAPAETSATEPAARKPVVEARPEAAPEPRVAIVGPAEPVSAGRGLRIGGMTAAVVGVAGIATGLFLNLKANSMAKELEAANGSSTTLYLRSKESSRSTYETWGWVAYGAGAACLAAGAILYYLGYSEPQTTPMAFVPTAGVGNVGAALQGAF